MSQLAIEDSIYTEHLAKVNESNKVVSTEDIYNKQGVLLVSKNTEIDENAAVRLVKHKLKKSVSLSIAVENVLDEKQLYQGFEVFFSDFKEIKIIHDKLELDKNLRIGCLYFKAFSLLRQKLTVMKSSLPELFRKSISGAWYALAIAQQLDYSTEQIKQVFIAALVRDVGMMHIDPEVIRNNLDSSDTSRKLINGHVLISKMVLDEVSNLPASVKRAVFEHHERCDGAGYPKGKQASELTCEGQIVAVSDTIQEIVYRYHHRHHKLANLEGFLILNTSTYGDEVYKGVVSLIKQSDEKPASNLDKNDAADYINNLLQTNEIFMDVCFSLNQLHTQLVSDFPSKEEIILRNFISRIADMRVKAGVPSEEYARWMEYVKNEQIVDAYHEMETAGMMFDELAWQLDQIGGYISTLWQLEDTPDEKRAVLEDCISLINKAIEISNFRRLRG